MLAWPARQSRLAGQNGARSRSAQCHTEERVPTPPAKGQAPARAASPVMHTAVPPSHRQPLPDALRALALLAVLAVNATGYAAAPWGTLLGEPLPAASWAARAWQGLLAALLQGKGWPMLAFLFGMSLALAMRRAGPADALAARLQAIRRQKRLLALGVLHGVLLYFGDILTLYAVLGWLLLRSQPTRPEPWRLFRPRLRRAAMWALAAVLVGGALAWWFDARWGSVAHASEPRLVQASHYLEFIAINADAYALGQVSVLLLGWQVARLCLLCGMASVRLRLLTHPRWHPALRSWVKAAALPLLGSAVVYGLAVAQLPPGQLLPTWADTLGQLSGPPTAALAVAALALASGGGRARWCAWIAPLGRCTLSVYIGHSALCMLLFTPLGLGLVPSTLQMAGFWLGLWLLALAAAHATGSRRWPLEAWLARR